MSLRENGIRETFKSLQLSMREMDNSTSDRWHFEVYKPRDVARGGGDNAREQ